MKAASEMAGRHYNRPMHVYIYRAARRADTYLYLAREDDFAAVPPPVLERLGELAAVMDFDLQPGRKLARADTAVVLNNLTERGFYLQAPPLTELPGDAAW